MQMTFDRKLFFSTYVQLVVLATLISGSLFLTVAFVLSPLGIVENLLMPAGIVLAVLLSSGYFLLLKKEDHYARIIGATISLVSMLALAKNVFQDFHLPTVITLYPLSALYFLTTGICLMTGFHHAASSILWRVSAIAWFLISVLLLVFHWTYPIGNLLGSKASASTLSSAFMLLSSPCLLIIPQLRKQGIHWLSRNALGYALTTMSITCLTWYILNLQYYQSVRQTSDNLVTNLQQGIEEIVKEHRLIISWLGRGWEAIPLDSTIDKNESLSSSAEMILGDMPSLKAIALLSQHDSTLDILAERTTGDVDWPSWISASMPDNGTMPEADVNMVIDSTTNDAWLLIQQSLVGTDDRIIAISKFDKLLNHHLHIDTKPYSIHVFSGGQEVYHLGGNDHEHTELVSSFSTLISGGLPLTVQSIHGDRITEAFLPNLLILLVIFGMVLSVIIATSIELSRFNYSRAESIKRTAARQLKIQKIQAMIANHDPLTNTLQKICELLDETLLNIHSSIWLREEKTSTFQYAASSRISTTLKGSLSRWKIPVDEVVNDYSMADIRQHETINTSKSNTDNPELFQSGYSSSQSILIGTANSYVLGLIRLYQLQNSTDTDGALIDDNTAKNVDELIPLMSMAIERHQDRERLMYSSQHDALTGLPNRTVLENRLYSWFKSNLNEQSNACLLFMDLDGFKPINDGLGHSTGDLVLVEVAERLKQIFRTGDLIVRFGGDEFVILILDNEDPSNSSQLVKRLLSSISEPYHISNLEISVTASIGIATTSFPELPDNPMSLIQQADIAMYDAKRKGKNSAQWYDKSHTQNVRSQVTLRNELQKALSNNEFELHYQPIILSNGNVRGFEALIRWNHPEYGHIPPDEFIPLAEETGQIIPLSEWVLDRACSDAAKLRFNDEISLGVNIAPLHFHRTDFIPRILETLDKYNLKPNALVLELTERTLMDEHGTMIHTLKTLRKSGLQISIDDFGTGYSSLSLIKHLPVSSIKIDKSFVSDIDYSEVDAGMARAIIDMGHHLSLSIVAEGVETQEQLRRLRDWGCDSFQGYHLCRPADVETILTFIDSWDGFPKDKQ